MIEWVFGLLVVILLVGVLLSLASIFKFESKKNSDCSLIIAACEKADIPTLEKLLAKNVNLVLPIPLKSTPLHVAVESGQIEVVKFLIKKGANVNAKDSNDNTPLHCVMEYEPDNALEIIKILISAGADINAKGTSDLRYHYDCTPLHIILLSGDPLKEEITKMLLAAGADPNIKSSDGTALEIATELKETQLINLLKQ